MFTAILFGPMPGALRGGMVMFTSMTGLNAVKTSIVVLVNRRGLGKPAYSCLSSSNETLAISYGNEESLSFLIKLAKSSYRASYKQERIELLYSQWIMVRFTRDSGPEILNRFQL